MILLFILIGLSVCRAAANCITVQGEFIRVSDVASHISETPLPAEEILLRTPAVGVRRVVERAEVRRLLRLPDAAAIPSSGLCFEQESDTLTEEHILESMRTSFAGQQVSIRLVDFSRYPIPKGRIEFPRNGLHASRTTRTEQRILWRGRVLDTNGKSTPIWARLHLEAMRDVLVASRNIEAGERIQPGDLELVRRSVFPLDEKTNLPATELTGLAARHRIASGSEVTRLLLAEPYDVEPRQIITLTVHSAGVQLRLPAIAEGRARQGDLVWLKQANTGKRVRARVTGPRQAILELKSTSGEITTNEAEHSGADGGDTFVRP